jgi:hypothetical protein
MPKSLESLHSQNSHSKASLMSFLVFLGIEIPIQVDLTTYEQEDTSSHILFLVPGLMEMADLSLPTQVPSVMVYIQCIGFTEYGDMIIEDENGSYAVVDGERYDLYQYFIDKESDFGNDPKD